LTDITFIGTGGGRFATIYQIRGTGGVYIEDGVRLHIDPGPGSLVYLKRARIDPAKTDCLMISHCHPDHYADGEVLIEGMTRGGFKRRGVLVASQSVLEGASGFGPAISSYHRSLVERTIKAGAGMAFPVGDVEVKVTPTTHGDPTGVGFSIHTSDGEISYVGDSQLTPELIRSHRDARMLLLNVTRPLGGRVAFHMCTEDAAEMAEKIRPEMVVITHMGMKLLHDGPKEQADYIESHSGVRCIAAEDLMKVRMGKRIRVIGRRWEDRAAANACSRE